MASVLRVTFTVTGWLVTLARVALRAALAALILSRMPASVFSVAPIGMVIAAAPAFGVNDDAFAPHVPRVIVRPPVPTTALESAKAPAVLTTDCVDESALTW